MKHGMRRLGCVTLASLAIIWGIFLSRVFPKFHMHIKTYVTAKSNWKTREHIGNQQKSETIRDSEKSTNGFCTLNPCQNEKACTNTSNRYVCFCKHNFIRKHCQLSNDEKHRKREELWIEAVKNSTEKSKRKRIPDVIGIGVEKCGTDALIGFLRKHPLVKTPDPAETHYFIGKYKSGLDFYLNLMPMVTEDEIIMEKTPAYFNFPPTDVPYRIKNDVPNAKILLVLCDPVNRTYSDFVHQKLMGTVPDNVDYDTFVSTYLHKYESNLTASLHKPDSDSYSYVMKIHRSDAPSHIITTGMYYYHLLRWRELFDSDNLYIISGEDMISQPGIEFEKLQRFLNLPEMLLKEDFVYNKEKRFFCFQPKSSNKIQTEMKFYHRRYCLADTKGRTRNRDMNVSETTLDSLRKFYKPFNEKLFRLLNRKMAWQ